MFAAFRLSSCVRAMSGEMLLIWLPEMSKVFSEGIPARTDILDIELPERLRLSRLVHAARAEMSVMPQLARLSSVTSLLKVNPPRVISVTASFGSSVRMVQPGSSSSSACSSSSVISRPRMSSVVRLSNW